MQALKTRRNNVPHSRNSKLVKAILPDAEVADVTGPTGGSEPVEKFVGLPFITNHALVYIYILLPNAVCHVLYGVVAIVAVVVVAAAAAAAAAVAALRYGHLRPLQ